MKVKINGREFQFTEPTSILKALNSVGIEIPTLCNDERVKACGACHFPAC